MFKQIGQMASMLKQAQQMQGKLKEIQEKLADVHVTGDAGAGMVRVEANGQQKILSVQIEPTVFDSNDREMLEDLVRVATNQALEKAREEAAQQMSGLTGDVDLPGLNDALSELGLGEKPAP